MPRWRTLGKRVLQVAGALVLLAAAKRVLQPDHAVPQVDAALRARAEQIHAEAIVVDGHNDVPMWMVAFGFDLGTDGSTGRMPWPYLTGFFDPPPPDDLRTDTDLARMRAGGLDAQFFSVFVDPQHKDVGVAKDRALEIIAAIEAQVEAHPQDLELARTAADVRDIAGRGKIAALMGIEGGHAIENDLENLRMFFGRGVRYMTLTWSFSLDWADSSGDMDDEDVEHHDGLTDFGREVVAEMNRLGMLVDISHVSDATFWDVIETTNAPVIASHSSARAVAGHARNMTDEMLVALANNGGVAMVNFATWFLDPNKVGGGQRIGYWLWRVGDAPTPLSLLADHVDHMVEVAGVDHVGLGSDFDGVLELPDQMTDVGMLPNLTVELLRRGHSEEDLHKILGGNVLRVMQQVEAFAAAAGTASAGERQKF